MSSSYLFLKTDVLTLKDRFVLQTFYPFSFQIFIVSFLNLINSKHELKRVRNIDYPEKKLVFMAFGFQELVLL